MSARNAKRRAWWAVLGTRQFDNERTQKTYVTLNVAGKSDRPITVVGSLYPKLPDAPMRFVCLFCVSHTCDHCLFVADHVAQHRAGRVDAVGTRLFSTETPLHETLHPWPGEHFGKRLCDVPRATLHQLVSYYGAKKRRGIERYEELLAAAQHTLSMRDAGAGDFESFPEALRDEDNDKLPWEQ